MKDQDYQDIKDKLLKFAAMGYEMVEATGAIKIGKAPYRAPLAILNCLYSPINKSDILFLEKEMNKKIPKPYQKFLTEFSNGLDIMTTTLSLYGLRKNYIRTLEFVWQPFDIVTSNKYQSEKPTNADDDMFFIGFYDDDGSNLYMTPDEKVHFCKQDDATSLITWPSLKDMLESEIDRIYALFDDNGVPFDRNAPTVPIV